MNFVPKKPFEDWTIFKYGWLIVFTLHMAFLAVGVHYMMAAYNMDHPDLLKAQGLRGTYLIIAGYMMVIAFSVLLLVLSILVFEVFRSQRKILRKLESMGIDAENVDEGDGVGADEDDELLPSDEEDDDVPEM